MKYLNFRDALDDYRFTYDAASKAKVIAKIVGVGVANTAIFTANAIDDLAKATPEITKRLQEQVEKAKNNRGQ